MQDDRPILASKQTGALLTLLGLASLTLSACGGAQAPHPAHPGVKVASRLAPTVVTVKPQSVYVPGVARQSVSKAKAAIAGAGLVASVVKQQSATVPAGQVIGTTPPSFAFVTKGQRVGLLVSTGPSMVKVPGVNGDSESVAEAKLTGAGLLVVVTQRAGSARADSVIAQAPASGTDVTRGSAVKLTVSIAPAMVTIPNVVGETEEAAVTTASKLGLAIVFKTKTVLTVSRDRVVVAQAPIVGEIVPKGFQLTLTVGVYAPPGATSPGSNG